MADEPQHGEPTLSTEQVLRLKALDLVRQMCLGEEETTHTVLAMAAWVLDGRLDPAFAIAEHAHRLYDQTDAVRYRPEAK